jgi:Tfp pilus assembly protein PilF
MRIENFNVRWIFGLLLPPLLLISICGRCLAPASAQNESGQQLSVADEIKQVETAVLGNAPENQPVGERMDAIETKLFGHPMTGGLLSRLSQVRISMKQKEANGELGDIGHQGDRAIKAKPGVLQVEISEADKLALPQTTVADSGKTDYEQAYDELKAKNYKAAEDRFKQMLVRSPTDHRAYYGLATIADKQGNYVEAYVNAAIAWYIYPLQDMPYGTALNAEAENISRTEAPLFKAEPKPDFPASDPKSLLNLGVRIWRMQHSTEAMKLFQFISQQAKPSDAEEAFFNMGAIAEQAGHLNRAMQYYQLAQEKGQVASMLRQQQFPRLMHSSPFFAADPKFDQHLETAISDVQWQLSNNKHFWTGDVPEKGHCLVCGCCLISRGR